jgi:hypothetical protein
MTNEQPRAYTMDEVRAKFIAHAREMAEAAALQYPDKPLQAAACAVFQVLAVLDGCLGGLPGFRVVSHPHSSDAASQRGRGENWFPVTDIAGRLHDDWYDGWKAIHP